MEEWEVSSAASSILLYVEVGGWFHAPVTLPLVEPSPDRHRIEDW